MKMNIFSRKDRSQAESAPDKQKKHIDPILKTYWISLISLMLCVTMFFGTTVAWFSDDVTAPYNRIDVGTLSVKLEYKKPGSKNTYVDMVKEANTKTTTAKVFDSDIPWAPGYTAVREIRVSNHGSLNLRYMFTFQEGEKDGSYKWDKEVAKWFEVYVKDGSFAGYDLPDNYTELKNEIKNGVKVWTPVMTMDGEVANLAQIVEQKLTVNTETIMHKEDSQADDTTHSFLIALHMKEDANIDMSGQKLALGAYLLAYQHSTDEDDLGDTSQLFFARNAAELRAAVKNDRSDYTIVLGGDIELDGDLIIGKSLQLDLNGHTLTLKDKAGDEFHGSLLVSGNNAKLVIRDRTVVGENAVPGKIIPDGHISVINGATLIVNGGTLRNVEVSGSTMVMNGGVVDESTTGKNGITMVGHSQLELNYGYLKVKEGSFSVYAVSGPATISVADTFHFEVGTGTEAQYAKKTADVVMKVNDEAIDTVPTP